MEQSQRLPVTVNDLIRESLRLRSQRRNAAHGAARQSFARRCYVMQSEAQSSLRIAGEAR